MDIHFRDLLYFKQLAETKNFSRASERLGISQPALTLSLKRLEAAVGVDLLIRGRSGASLTKAGESFLPRAIDLLHQWKNVTQDIFKGTSEVQGRFTLGCHESVARYCLSQFLPELLEMYPYLQINLLHDLSRHITEKVISKELDFGLVINPIRHPDLVLIKIAEDVVHFWVSKDVTLSERSCLIADFNLLQVQAMLKKWGMKNQRPYTRQIQSSSLDVATELCVKGVGVAIIPKRVAQLHPQFNKIKTFPSGPSFKDSLYLIYRADLQKGPAARAIIDAIKSRIA